MKRRLSALVSWGWILGGIGISVYELAWRPLVER